MAEKTDISWCDGTFNPWWGCAKVSAACDFCYAERDSKRFAAGQVLWGVDAERRVFGDKHWDQPLLWNRRPFFECSACGARGGDKAVGYQRVCKKCGSADIKPARMRVFCASMADVFDKNAPIGARERLWKLIEATPSLDWLLLTKRIGNARTMLPEAWLEAEWPGNVRVGITVIDQTEFDRDVPKLVSLDCPNFLSIEPMLGPIDMRAELVGRKVSFTSPLNWCIAGGESGTNARPLHPDWLRGLRDQCATAGVPFHFKQWGMFAPAPVTPAEFFSPKQQHQGERVVCADGVLDGLPDNPGESFEVMRRVGTAAAGRLLDGAHHNGFPERHHG